MGRLRDCLDSFKELVVLCNAAHDDPERLRALGPGLREAYVAVRDAQALKLLWDELDEDAARDPVLVEDFSPASLQRVRHCSRCSRPHAAGPCREARRAS